MPKPYLPLPSLDRLYTGVLLGLLALPAQSDSTLYINPATLRAAAGRVDSVQINGASTIPCVSSPAVKGDHCAAVPFTIKGLKCTSGAATYKVTLDSSGGCSQRLAGEFAKEGSNLCAQGSSSCNLSYPINAQCSAFSPRKIKVDVLCGNVVMKTSPVFPADSLN